MKQIVLVCIFLVSIRNSYSETSGDLYRTRLTLARSHTLAGLHKIHDKSSVHDKLTELVFFSRWLMLSPKSTVAAHGLLQTIPVNQKEAENLMILSDPPEKISASTSDLLALGNIHDRWPQLVARAVLLSPSDMTNYVTYLPLAAIDMHSDFTGKATRVCNKLPKEFRSAIAGLSKEDRAYVRRKVFDPDRCEAIFVGEAE